MKVYFKYLILIIFPFVFEISRRVAFIRNSLYKKLRNRKKLYRELRNTTKYSGLEFRLLLAKSNKLEHTKAKLRSFFCKDEYDFFENLIIPKYGNSYKYLLDSAKTALSAHAKRNEKRMPYLLLDISSLERGDNRTGIQRVSRSIINYLLLEQTKYYIVQPVYIDENGRLCKSKKYSIGLTLESTSEKYIIKPQHGDIYLGIDQTKDYFKDLENVFLCLKKCNVKIFQIIFDIIPISHPCYSKKSTIELFSRWFPIICQNADTLICISNSVANEVKDWIDRNLNKLTRKPNISSFHLGADFENENHRNESSKNFDNLINSLANKISFLMVGTIEPRKNYYQAIKAFENLWRENFDINLIFVGKIGWEKNSVIKYLMHHKERDKRFYLLLGIDDDFLEKIYSLANCLIFASNAEGFGLPLVEAARHKIPVIVRDIPVFHEIAKENAFYFSGTEPLDLSTAIKEWLKLYEKSFHPRSENIKWLTWKESVKQLTDILLISEK